MNLRWSLGTLVLTTLASGCFSPTFPTGRPCQADSGQSQCPDGQTCQNQICVLITPIDGPLSDGADGPNAGTVAQIWAGRDSTFARASDGTMYAWGANPASILGDRTILNRNIPALSQNDQGRPLESASKIVSSSETAACALVGTQVYCWGAAGFFHLLGLPDSNNYLLPQLVTGTDSIVALGAGIRHSCVVLQNGTVRCWGENSFAEIGEPASAVPKPYGVEVALLNDARDVCATATSSCAIRGDKRVVCWGEGFPMDGRRPEIPSMISDAVGASRIACGSYHACILDESGRVLCWGVNSEGQLGDNTTAPRANAVAVSGLESITAISLGDDFGCARAMDGSIYCWGANSEGNLGNGTQSRSLVPIPVLAPEKFAAIATGAKHACFLKADHTGVLCTGANNAGQLGDGTTELKRLSPVAVRF